MNLDAALIYIRRRWMRELLIKSSVMTLFVCIIASFSAFIHFNLNNNIQAEISTATKAIVETDNSQTDDTKPVISSKIAKLIQATSPSNIDISQHYTIIG